MQDSSTRERLAFSPAEAAEVLGISRAHLYHLLEQGDLPSLKLGRSRRIRREALEGYLQELEAKSTDAGPVES